MLLLTFDTAIPNRFACVTFLQFDVVHFCCAAGCTAHHAISGSLLFVLIILPIPVDDYTRRQRRPPDNSYQKSTFYLLQQSFNLILM